METIRLKCDICGKRFDRRKAEVTRCRKRGLERNFCSRKCCGEGTKENRAKAVRVTAHLKANNRLDEFSPFRWHLRNVKQRKKRECNLTLEYLKELWDDQSGRCPYTGWELKNMRTMDYNDQLPLTPDRASLDRIDSSKGYIKGNVQFVALIAQHAKHTFAETDLISFCKSVTSLNRKAKASSSEAQQ